MNLNLRSNKFVLLLLCVSIFITACPKKVKQPNSPSNRTTPTSSPSALSLTLSTEEVKIPCPPGLTGSEPSCGTDQSVAVTASAQNSDQQASGFTYTVSGGRIVGSGARVTWDLSGVRPGAYTITVQIGDGMPNDNPTVTKVVTVSQCDCRAACDTSVTRVRFSKDSVRRQETFTATADVNGPTSGVTYSWNVERGTIISGQGTSEITIKAANTIGEGSALVSLSGDAGCSASSSGFKRFIVTN